MKFLTKPGGSAMKNPPANAGDMSLIPGSGWSPGKEMATQSITPAWKIPWTEAWQAIVHSAAKELQMT